MQIIILLIVVFIISFLLLFKLVNSGNKQETKEEKLGIRGLLFVVFFLALIPVVLTSVIVFVLLGSTNVINLMFSLHISTKQIIIIAIALLIYLFTLDNVFEIIAKLIIGRNIFNLLLMLLVRVLVFYMIALLVGLDQREAFTIAGGVAVLVGLMELVFFLSNKRG